jgi:hypothetical protein
MAAATVSRPSRSGTRCEAVPLRARRFLARRQPLPVADLSATRTVGTQAIGDVGALIWVAEQLDLIGHIDRACGNLGAKGGPSVGELAVAVAIQRACSPGPKRDLAEFLDGAVPRLSCPPSAAFSGQAYHRVAQHVTDEQPPVPCHPNPGNLEPREPLDSLTRPNRDY